MTFTSVTPDAVRDALAAPRDISDDLVAAYKARVCMDRLLGFELSPVLQRRLFARSAGRVQSPALRLLCERETARDLFKVERYHTVEASLQSSASSMPVRTTATSADLPLVLVPSVLY